jgi:hypothetical protein
MCVFELGSERAFLGRNHNRVFAHQPASSTIEDEGLALYVLLDLGQRQFPSSVQQVPNLASGETNFFSHQDPPCKQDYPCLDCTMGSKTAGTDQAATTLACTGISLPVATFKRVTTSAPLFKVASTLSGSISYGRSNTQKI